MTVMDERVIKRLLIIFVLSIVAIILFKMGLSETYSTLNNAGIVKKQTASTNPSAMPQPPASSVAAITDTHAASSVGEALEIEAPAASGVSVTQ